MPRPSRTISTRCITSRRRPTRSATPLKRNIFASDLDLAHKIHLRYFALNVELVSDRAEEVADRLAIYAIKRNI